jgi:hypothetical protein
VSIFDQVQKQFVKAAVVGELRMKSGREEVIATRSDDPAIGQRRQHFHCWADVSDDRSANEDGVKGRIAEVSYIEIRLKAIYLATKGVALDANVHQREIGTIQAGGALGKDNRAGARAPHRKTFGAQCPQRLEQIVGIEQSGHGRALAARDDQSIEAGELRWQADLARFSADRDEASSMLRKIALKGEDANGRHKERLCRLPAANGKQFCFRNRLRRDAAHGGADASRNLRDDGWILVVGYCLDDRLGALFRLV